MSKRYSITVTMTPKQAVYAEAVLREEAVSRDMSTLFTGAHRVSIALREAGWEQENKGTDDEPKWWWVHERETP